MGTKGARASEGSRLVAETLVTRLQPMGPVSSRSMFGGHGIFLDGVMFAMVDSSGSCLLRADDASRPRFEAQGSQRHARMPYWGIPDPVLSDDETLLEWAGQAIEAAIRAK